MPENENVVVVDELSIVVADDDVIGVLESSRSPAASPLLGVIVSSS